MSHSLQIFASELLRKLCEDHPMGYVPKLTWKKLRVTAGIAFYHRKEIVLSSVVLDTHDRLENTLLHEYAHLLAVERHGMNASGHGTAWKEAMRELGLSPTVHHTYEVQRNSTRQKVVYRCMRCGTRVDRARRLPRRRRYVHANCGGALRLESIDRIGAAA